MAGGYFGGCQPKRLHLHDGQMRMRLLFFSRASCHLSIHSKCTMQPHLDSSTCCTGSTFPFSPHNQHDFSVSGTNSDNSSLNAVAKDCVCCLNLTIMMCFFCIFRKSNGVPVDIFWGIIPLAVWSLVHERPNARDAICGSTFQKTQRTQCLPCACKTLSNNHPRLHTTQRFKYVWFLVILTVCLPIPTTFGTVCAFDGTPSCWIMAKCIDASDGDVVLRISDGRIVPIPLFFPQFVPTQKGATCSWWLRCVCKKTL